MKIGEVGWGGKCWLCSGVLLNRNFRSIDSLFFFGARNLMMAYLWCLPVMMFFPPGGVPSTPPYSTLNSDIWELVTSESRLPRQQFWSISPLFPQHFYLEQGDRAYLELVLMLCYEMLKVQIIASWGTCCRLLLGDLFEFCWKSFRTRKRASTKEGVGGMLGSWLWCVKPVRAGQKGIVWCNWAAPGLRLPLETAQAFWCILLFFFFFFIVALQLSGWPA